MNHFIPCLLLICGTCVAHAAQLQVEHDSPQLQFGLSALELSLQALPDELNVVARMDPELGAQSYRVNYADNTLNIHGGCSVGLMYGCLELAERLKLG